MDNLQTFKEQQINDYLSSIDMVNIDVNQLKNDLRNKLGEEPAIRLNYDNQQMVSEDGSKTGKRVERLDSVSITFTVEREFRPGQTAPFPVTKTFIVG